MYRKFKTYMLNVPTACSCYDTSGFGRPGIVISGWNSGTGDGSREGLDARIIALINQHITNADMRVRLTRFMIGLENSVSDEDDFLFFHTPAEVAQELKIYIAPEFYFRPPCVEETHGEAYSLPEYEELKSFFDNYFRLCPTIHPYQSMCHWLILCGTCVYNNTRTPGRQRINNSMLAYYVDAQGNAHLREIRKTVTSNIDGVRRREDSNSFLNRRYSQIEADNHYLENLKVFVEICLEHGNGYMVAFRKRRPAAAIKAQVICAAGMDVQLGRTYQGTVIIRNDGMLKLTDQEMMSAFETYAGMSVVPAFDGTQKRQVYPWRDFDIRSVVQDPSYALYGNAHFVPSVYYKEENSL